MRTLQELIAAGWSDAEVATRVRAALDGWRRTLADVAADAEPDVGGYGPLTADQVGDLVCFAFLGAESVLLLDDAEVAPRNTSTSPASRSATSSSAPAARRSC